MDAISYTNLHGITHLDYKNTRGLVVWNDMAIIHYANVQ